MIADSWSSRSNLRRERFLSCLEEEEEEEEEGKKRRRMQIG